MRFVGLSGVHIYVALNYKADWLYEGAKEMLLVENMDDRAFLQSLFAVIAEELTTPKRGRK